MKPQPPVSKSFISVASPEVRPGRAGVGLASWGGKPQQNPTDGVEVWRYSQWPGEAGSAGKKFTTATADSRLPGQIMGSQVPRPRRESVMAASAARVMVGKRRCNWRMPDRRRDYGVWGQGFG